MQEIVHGQVVDGHLGGYVPGGDPNTIYPKLWDWFAKKQGVRYALDVGCGDGSGFMRHMADLGVAVEGVDGMPSDDSRIVQHDFTTGPGWNMDEGGRWTVAYDLVWSCEFVEHVHEEFVPNFLPSFTLGQMVAMTHAVPGQGGHHHVNLQTSDYWVGVMAAIGYRLDPDLTQTARLLANQCPGDYPFFAHTGMVFRRVG